jgi:hypothetical protein
VVLICIPLITGQAEFLFACEMLPGPLLNRCWMSWGQDEAVLLHPSAHFGSRAFWGPEENTYPSGPSMLGPLGLAVEGGPYC